LVTEENHFTKNWMQTILRGGFGSLFTSQPGNSVCMHPFPEMSVQAYSDMPWQHREAVFCPSMVVSTWVHFVFKFPFLWFRSRNPERLEQNTMPRVMVYIARSYTMFFGHLDMQNKSYEAGHFLWISLFPSSNIKTMAASNPNSRMQESVLAAWCHSWIEAISFREPWHDHPTHVINNFKCLTIHKNKPLIKMCL